ncbi:MAG: TIGR03013 family PEP-CTERM/XrtA system glycosyltransferase [Proteobacteria bacterium]|nr:TIGR03013 family PEP-CTERM/XrtA system glycosyltransferase [Pseudomonadota bacterium]
MLDLRLIPKKKILLFLGDVLLIPLAYFLSLVIRFGVSDYSLLKPSIGGGFVILCYIFTFYIADLYELDKPFRSIKYIFRFITAIFIASIITLGAFYFFPKLWFGRGIFVISIILVGLFTYSWRLLFAFIFRKLLYTEKNLIIIGSDELTKYFSKLFESLGPYKVKGFICESLINKDDCSNVLGTYEQLSDIVEREKIDIVIIAVTHIENTELLKYALECKMKGVHVVDLPTFYEEVTGKVPVELVNDLWLVTTPISGVKRSIYNMKVKRILDIIFSILGLLASLIITIPVAILIKIESRGPVFYRQRRVGLNNRIFECIKFRSMTVHAEKNGAVWASKNDNRVTRVGKVIRKLRIDEIPQMWNVLKGDMSFIGPRPERPEFVELLEKKIPYYNLRHSVKPGITGWAQVCYPYGASEEDALEKLKYDLYYIKNLSLFLDFQILLKTAKVVLLGQGAR